jgi:hypothetical protein
MTDFNANRLARAATFRLTEAERARIAAAPYRDVELQLAMQAHLYAEFETMYSPFAVKDHSERALSLAWDECGDQFLEYAEAALAAESYIPARPM